MYYVKNKTGMFGENYVVVMRRRKYWFDETISIMEYDCYQTHQMARSHCLTVCNQLNKSERVKNEK